jgi:hypothetical protein
VGFDGRGEWWWRVLPLLSPILFSNIINESIMNLARGPIALRRGNAHHRILGPGGAMRAVTLSMSPHISHRQGPNRHPAPQSQAAEQLFKPASTPPRGYYQRLQLAKVTSPRDPSSHCIDFLILLTEAYCYTSATAAGGPRRDFFPQAQASC